MEVMLGGGERGRASQNASVQRGNPGAPRSVLDAMDSDNDWSAILNDHPIFSLPSSSLGQKNTLKSSLELSSNTLPDFASIGEENLTPSGRRQVMLLKAADLILAVGKEIRMASLGDARLNPALRKTYKVRPSLPLVL